MGEEVFLRLSLACRDSCQTVTKLSPGRPDTGQGQKAMGLGRAGF